MKKQETWTIPNQTKPWLKKSCHWSLFIKPSLHTLGSLCGAGHNWVRDFVAAQEENLCHFKSHTRPRRLTQKCALSSVNFRANRIEAKLLAAHFTTPVNVCVCSPDLGVVTLEELSEIYKNKTGVWMKRLGVEWSLGYRSFELQLTIITNCWWQRRLEISEVESEMSDTIYKASRSSSLSTTF